jgi:CheY-like chemotaxis protein
VLLADDFPLFLERVSSHLEPAFEVVEKVGDGQSLFEAATKLDPDLIVTDLSMPVLNGLEAVKRLKESGCAARIVFLTVNTDPDVVQAGLAAGALAPPTFCRLSATLLRGGSSFLRLSQVRASQKEGRRPAAGHEAIAMKFRPFSSPIA